MGVHRWNPKALCASLLGMILGLALVLAEPTLRRWQPFLPSDRVAIVGDVLHIMRRSQRLCFFNPQLPMYAVNDLGVKGSRYIASGAGFYFDLFVRSDGRFGVYYTVLLPTWFTALAGASLMLGSVALMCRRGVVRSPHADPGLCSKCGYDLRGSPGACPECGERKTGRQDPMS